VTLTANSPRAELYGVFHLLEEVGTERDLPADEVQTASAAIRWTDEWDNLDGTIERGYAGRSIFFENGHVRQDLSRASAYARLLASIGINGCNVNNVNADLDLLTPDHLKEYARIAEVFRPWGVKLALSVDLTSPQRVGGLPTFDPLDPTVIAWWKRKVDEIYTLIPDFGGFTVKADSEGRKGPAQYGRSPADAANVLARALGPHHGVVLYRGFVYNNHLDWRDPKADRARAGVDNFVRFDGQFEPNVVIQVKEGPIDFQAREPVSPLFAALRHTNVAIELQTTQEYTGQQRHMVWLPSMWKWVLDTDLRAEGRVTPVKAIVEGRAFPSADGRARLGGYVSVTNVGLESNWLHHPMAMANLYGFGRLAWNPDEALGGIIDTWTRLTWGNDPEVDRVIDALQTGSWQVYEGYTGPNGMGTLTNILGYHFGPGIESAERNGWGQWFRGDKSGIGMDRTSGGTGYAQQYPAELAATYESLASCPDDLLLFFHHVPYDHRLHSGQTLIQSIYDRHYASAREAAEYVPRWMTLKGRVDEDRYQEVLKLFTYQAGHAVVWRDAIDEWFFRMSRIEDGRGRVGHRPNRIEAEEMVATGYEPVEVSPWETASGGRAVVCRSASGCSLSTTLKEASGSYDIAVQYFDVWRGVSRFELLLNGVRVARWEANDTLPPAQFDPHLDGQTSTRFTAHHVPIHTGDTLVLKGMPDLRPELDLANAEAAAPGALNPSMRERRDYRELAPVDYIEVGPDGPVTPQ
jgi:alpha-glucuronidase